jgi:ribosomal protein S12 methylthiotransferase accessory factor
VSTLLNSKGIVAAEGAGKGADCRVGALAESIEHYALEHLSSQHVHRYTVNDVQTQSLLKFDGVLANLSNPEACLDCVEMTDLQTDRIIKIPAVLQIPNPTLIYDLCQMPELKYLSRYSTNSGTAFGCSESEAMLHGLNEVIERHTLSTVLMSLCGQHDSLMLKSPDAEILNTLFPGKSQTDSIISRYKILFMPTTFGVYFSMAIPKAPDERYPICPIGSGCSVDPRIAIERAITELSQTIDLYDTEEKSSDLIAYALLKRSPALHPLIHLEKLRNIGHTCKRLDPLLNLSVVEQAEFVIEHLNALGFRVLRRTLATFANGCAVTQIYVPGLERFNLVRAGIPVVPQRLLHANACS